MDLPKFAFFGGRIVPYSEAKVGVLTHSLNYGTGCFAGIRGHWNEEEKELFVFRPRDHFRRFLDSSRILSMEIPFDADALTGSLLELLRTEQLRTDCYIRPLAFFSDETIGVRLHDLKPAVSIVAFPFGKYLDRDGSAHLTISGWRRVEDNQIPARGKITGAYVNSSLAKSDAHRAGFDDAILLDSRGKISEGSAANIFIVRNGVALTPGTTDSILEGITRRTLIQFLRDDLAVPVEERSIDRTELLLASEAFLCGTGVGIVPITRVDHRPIGAGKPGDVTTALEKLYGDTVRGRAPKYRGWCEPVYGASAVKAASSQKVQLKTRTPE
jgi:branched-chain amino acid aminotransferase